MNKIVLKDVSKTIKGVEILSELNQEFVGGKIYGLCGSNGSGKTMLLRLIAGLIRPSKGEILVDDKILHKDIDFPANMGVMIENPEFWPYYTGKEPSNFSSPPLFSFAAADAADDDSPEPQPPSITRASAPDNTADANFLSFIISSF